MHVYSPACFTIRNIQLLGDITQEAQSAVEKVVSPQLGKGLFEINAHMLQTQLLTRFTWIDSVIVKRTIAGILIVRLKLRRPVARFENMDRTPSKIALLDNKGYIFDPMQDIEHFQHVPHLIGLTTQVNYILHFYKELNTMLQAQNLKITQLQLDQEMRFNVKLNNGIRLLLGHIHPLDQLKRLLNSNVAVLQRPDQIASIDLRYSRGMAVKLHESIK